MEPSTTSNTFSSKDFGVNLRGVGGGALNFKHRLIPEQLGSLAIAYGMLGVVVLATVAMSGLLTNM